MPPESPFFERAVPIILGFLAIFTLGLIVFALGVGLRVIQFR